MQAVERVEVVRWRECCLLLCQAHAQLAMTPCSSLDCTAYANQIIIRQSPDKQDSAHCSLLCTVCICALPSRHGLCSEQGKGTLLRKAKGAHVRPSLAGALDMQTDPAGELGRPCHTT